MNVREAVLTVDETQTSFLEQGPSLIERAARTAAASGCRRRRGRSRCALPPKAIDAAREQKLLGVMIPVEFGGEGASIFDVTDICYTLGRACASTAMIFAMHQTKVACLVRHGRGSPWHGSADAPRRAPNSCCSPPRPPKARTAATSAPAPPPSTSHGARISLMRDATVISYGAQADGIVTIARRATDAAASDQVLVAFTKDDYTLERTLGLGNARHARHLQRRLRAEGERLGRPDLPGAYDKIHAQTMTPVAHLCWSSAWAGIAAAAVDARAGVHPQGGPQLRRPDAAGRGAFHRAPEMSLTQTARADRIGKARHASGRAEHDERALELARFPDRRSTCSRCEASELAVATVMSAMRACGLSGYRNDGEFSVGRHLRDVLSSPMMINNDRILANVATATPDERRTRRALRD